MRKVISLFIFISSLSMSLETIAQRLSVLPIYGFDLHIDEAGEQLAYIDYNTKKIHIYDLNTAHSHDTGLNAKGLLVEGFTDKSLQFQKRGKEVIRKTYLTDQKSVVELRKSPNIVAYPSPNLRGVVVENGSKTKVLRPLNGFDFINVSISPDKSRILFRASGNGSYVIDLDGKIVTKLDSAQFPTWVNKDEVLYAEVKDDGHQYLSSRLFIENLKTGLRKELEVEEEVIPLYPVSSKNGEQVFFSSASGRIFKLDMEE